MEAIVTTYTTRSSGSGRMKATAFGHTITLPFQHRLDNLGNHEAAARALAQKMGRHVGYALVSGLMPNGHDYVWLFVRTDGRRRG
jgi:hypothetical protein